MLVWSCVQNVQKRLATKSFGLQSPPTGMRPIGRPRTRWPDYISDLAWSRLGAERGRTTWDCCWLWGISGPPRAAPPATLPKRKAHAKTSEWLRRPTLKWICRPTVYLWNCL